MEKGVFLSCNVRFDVICIDGDKIRHIISAFEDKSD